MFTDKEILASGPRPNRTPWAAIEKLPIDPRPEPEVSFLAGKDFGCNAKFFLKKQDIKTKKYKIFHTFVWTQVQIANSGLLRICLPSLPKAPKFWENKETGENNLIDIARVQAVRKQYIIAYQVLCSKNWVPFEISEIRPDHLILTHLNGKYKYPCRIILHRKEIPLAHLDILRLKPYKSPVEAKPKGELPGSKTFDAHPPMVEMSQASKMIEMLKLLQPK